MSKRKFRKSVESIQRQIAIHQQKVIYEQQKSVPDEKLIHYWLKEIKGLEKSLAKAEKRLKRG